MLGWRTMFVLGGLCGALVVWYRCRKKLPESPRWLESVGKTEEAEVLLQSIEAEVSLQHSPLPPPTLSPLVKHSRNLSSLFSPASYFRA